MRSRLPIPLASVGAVSIGTVALAIALGVTSCRMGDRQEARESPVTLSGGPAAAETAAAETAAAETAAADRAAGTAPSAPTPAEEARPAPAMSATGEPAATPATGTPGTAVTEHRSPEPIGIEPIVVIEPTVIEPTEPGTKALPIVLSEKIPPTTKRTAAGLPDPIPGYQAWFRLEPTGASPPGTEGAHLPVRQAYLQLPLDATVPASRTLTAPLLAGTTIVLESKSEPTDFVASVSAIQKTKDGLQYSQYTRSSADAPFTQGSTDSCAGCHATAPSDGIFSKLVLR